LGTPLSKILATPLFWSLPTLVDGHRGVLWGQIHVTVNISQQNLIFAAKFLLIFLAFFLNPTNQQQNLHGTDGRRIFVADPSSCHKHLLCRWNFSSNPPRLMSVHQYDCRDFGSNHFQTSSDGTTGICVTNNIICFDPLGLCPPANIMN